MNEFDKSFISKFEINDLTEEEINNLRIQRNKIDKILNSYKDKQDELYQQKTEDYIGRYFKEIINEKTIVYYKILMNNPYYYLNFILSNSKDYSSIIHHKSDVSEYYEFDDAFFNIIDDGEIYFDGLTEITEEEFNTAMDRKYQEFKQELSNIPNNIEVDEKGR